MDTSSEIIEVPWQAYIDVVHENFGMKFTGVIKDSDGDIIYFKDGGWHREDGPAFVSHRSRKDDRFWLNNVHMQYVEWLRFVELDEVTKTYYWIVYGARNEN